MEQNRLQVQWPYIVEKLKTTYPRVPEGLWERTGGRHDEIVHTVRATYAPGRASITVEAEVRDHLNTWVASAEAAEQ